MRKHALFQFQRTGSLRRKTVRMLFMQLLLSGLVICASASIFLSVQFKQSNYAKNLNMIEQTGKALNSLFVQMDQVIANIVFGNDVQAYLRGGYTSAYDAYMARKKVVNILTMYQNTQDGVLLSVVSYYENPVFGNSLLNSELQYKGGKYLPKDAPWYADTEKYAGEWTIFVPDCIQDYLSEKARKPMHTKIYRIWDIYNLNQLGYLRVDIPVKAIADCFLDDYVGISDILLTDSNGRAIYNRGDKAHLLNRQTNGILSTEIMSQGWNLLVLPDSDVLRSHILTIVLCAACTLILLMALFTPFAFRFAERLLRPIEQLIHSMEQVRAGRLKQMIPVEGNDEISMLTGSFNAMTEQLDKMMDKLNVEQYLRKDAELKSLIQQVNPHFLYNTLDVIVGLITEGARDDAICACGTLAQMFKYNLCEDQKISVDGEIAQVKRYATLNSYRFSSRYQFNFDVPREIKTMEIVRFSIQPLVENAIRHAFGTRLEGCLIEISVRKEDTQLHLSVRDSGNGMEATIMNALNKSFQEESLNALTAECGNRHIGLKNVYSRLKHAYGNELTMRITSSPEKGTCVDIYIPCRIFRSNVVGISRT